MALRHGFIGILIGLASAAWAVPSLFEQGDEGIYVVRDDSGRWATDMSKDITHQSHALYQARKILDLSRVPEDLWERTRSVRLAVFFMVRAYSASAHRVWKFRPCPSRLKRVHNMIARGWASDFLCKDGKYRSGLKLPVNGYLADAAELPEGSPNP